MKKFIAMLLCLMMVVSLCACGGQEEAPAQTGENVVPMVPVEPEEIADMEEILAASETNAAQLAARTSSLQPAVKPAPIMPSAPFLLSMFPTKPILMLPQSLATALRQTLKTWMQAQFSLHSASPTL